MFSRKSCPRWSLRSGESGALQRIPVGRSLVVASCWLLLLGISGCESMPNAVTPWQLIWEVREEEHLLEEEVGEIFQLPPRLHGKETWWVAPRYLVTVSAGENHVGERGERWSWILPDEGWVFHFDRVHGEIEAEPLSLWEEERLRRSRGGLIQALEASESSARRGSQRFFFGDSHREVMERERGGTWSVVAAVPGLLWKLSGTDRWQVPWEHPLLCLGFPSVTRTRAAAVGSLLAQDSPSRIEEMVLPDGERAIVTVRRLKRARRRSLSPEIEQIGAQVRARMRLREERRGSFESLWGQLEDADQRDRDLTLRGVRVRLEPLVTVDRLPAIRERILALDDTALREELLHLVHVASAEEFDQWFADARARRDWSLILPMVSVRTLKRPGGMVSMIDALLGVELGRESSKAAEGAAEDGAQSLSPAERRQVRTWLEGVRRWLEVEYGPTGSTEQ